MDPDRAVTPDDVRRGFRELLNEVEHDNEHVTIMRYDTPSVVVVPVEWYEQAKAQIAALGYIAKREHSVPLKDTETTEETR